MKKRVSNKDFIERAILVHGDKYDYSLVDYQNSLEKVVIICKEHGEFLQTSSNHFKGKGCPLCGNKHRKESNRKSINCFLQEATKKHSNKYDYSKVDYINTHTKVVIICKKHGEFYQTPKEHIKGQGCPECGKIKIGDSLRLSFNDFVERANKLHKHRYDYSEVIYKNMQTKIKIFCKTHGFFLQAPSHHLEGAGCYRCFSSKGENIICSWLQAKGIPYVYQKRFIDCRDYIPLPFDFYLPNQKIFIEFQGKQHFEIASHWFTEQQFLAQQRRDLIKKTFAEKNGIYIEIRYDDNIENLLETLIFNYL